MKKKIKKWIIGAIVFTVIVCAVVLPFSHLGQRQGDGSSGEVRLDGVVYKPQDGGMVVSGATKDSVIIKTSVNNTPVVGVAASALKNNSVTHTVSFLGGFEKFEFGVGAFEGAAVSKLLNIPSVSLFDTGALRLMPELKEITASGGDVFVNSGILYQKNSTITTLVKVPTNITTLPANFSKNVSVIASGAFDYSKISLIDIPKTILRLEKAVFVNSSINRIILRNKSTVVPADAISPLSKELQVLVDAKNQVEFREYYNGGAAFIRKYSLYMYPLSRGYDTAGRVHCLGGNKISINGYNYTVNNDKKTISVDLGGGTRLTNVDAWYIL